MILGNIEKWYQYQHLETGKLVEVQDANVQMKFGNQEQYFPGSGGERTPSPWTTGVSYHVVGESHTFVTDVDSFRRKFKTPGPETQHHES